MTVLHSFVSPLGRAGALLLAVPGDFLPDRRRRLQRRLSHGNGGPAGARGPTPNPARNPGRNATGGPICCPTGHRTRFRVRFPVGGTGEPSRRRKPSPESADVPERGPAFPAAEEGDIEPILATTVLNPGTQRVAFLLVGPKAIVKAPQATVSAAYVGDQGEVPGGSGSGGSSPRVTDAVYHGWPYGIRGAYSTELNFDRPGAWRLDVGVDEGEVIGSASIELEVVEDSPIPAIGERPPLSRTKTLSDVAGIEQLTTDYTPDEEMYRISVADAIESPRPAVVVFSSPAFCTSPTCGPQLETVKELRAAYQDRADFVHVEIYDLPDEIQGDLSRATLVEAVDEWGFSSLPDWFNESWVFIINSGGLVEQRFEGFATLTELEKSLKEVLGEG